nr:costunolide synthase-like [Tanacetum cinerariifolium]
MKKISSLELLSAKKTLDKVFDDILKDYEQRHIIDKGDHGQEEDLLDVLLQVKNKGGLEFPITNNNIKAIFMDMFSGGTDTSSNTIEWEMTKMNRHPRVMKKAQDEVREAFKGKTKVKETDIQCLTYMQSVIKETLRLYVSLPLLIPRVCKEKCKIGGYDISVKTKVIVNAFACSTDPEYWEDTETFKPERFDNSSVDFIGPNYEFITFRSGRRMCPCINFGLVSVKLFLAQMLYYFDWKHPDGLSPMELDMTEIESSIVAKKVHLHLIPTSYAPQ